MGSHIVTVPLEGPSVSHIMSIKIVDILKACKQRQVEQALGLVEARNRYGGVERTSNMQVPPSWNMSSITEDSSSFSTNPSLSTQSQHASPSLLEYVFHYRGLLILLHQPVLIHTISTCKSLPPGICLPLPRTPHPSPPTRPYPHNLNMVGTRITQQDLRKEQHFIHKPGNETKDVLSVFKQYLYHCNFVLLLY